MENSKSFNGRIIAGILIIAVGVLILLDNLYVLPYDVSHIIFSWPMAMTAIGILSLLYSGNKTIGTILTVVGLFFLLPKIYPEFEINSGIVIPLLIILLGFFLIFKKSSSKSEFKSKFHINESKSNDLLDELVVFGGGSKMIYSDNFMGGQVTTLFGGMELDLTKCKLADNNRKLDIVAIFGGTEITVPSDWQVNVEVLPIFGGFSNKKYRNEKEVIPGEKTLLIKGVVIFGVGEIKYR